MAPERDQLPPVARDIPCQDLCHESSIDEQEEIVVRDRVVRLDVDLVKLSIFVEENLNLLRFDLLLSLPDCVESLSRLLVHRLLLLGDHEDVHRERDTVLSDVPLEESRLATLDIGILLHLDLPDLVFVDLVTKLTPFHSRCRLVKLVKCRVLLFNLLQNLSDWVSLVLHFHVEAALLLEHEKLFKHLVEQVDALIEGDFAGITAEEILRKHVGIDRHLVFIVKEEHFNADLLFFQVERDQALLDILVGRALVLSLSGGS